MKKAFRLQFVCKMFRHCALAFERDMLSFVWHRVKHIKFTLSYHHITPFKSWHVEISFRSNGTLAHLNETWPPTLNWAPNQSIPHMMKSWPSISFEDSILAWHLEMVCRSNIIFHYSNALHQGFNNPPKYIANLLQFTSSSPW